MRKVKGNIRKMLAAIVLTLLCCSAFAQRIVESGDLRTTTDEQHGTVVHYLKGGKRPLSGKFRILRGQDEEIVHFSKGVMQGETGVSATAACGKRASIPTADGMVCSFPIIRTERHRNGKHPCSTGR